MLICVFRIISVCFVYMSIFIMILLSCLKFFIRRKWRRKEKEIGWSVKMCKKWLIFIVRSRRR